MLPTPKAKTGQTMLVLAFVLLAVALLVVPPIVVRLHGVDGAGAPMFRLILTLCFVSLVVFATLGYLMWIGYGWARWISSFLLFAGGFFWLPYLDEFHGTAKLALIGMILFYLVLAGFLAFSKSIEEFIQEQERFRKINL